VLGLSTAAQEYILVLDVNTGNEVNIFVARDIVSGVLHPYN
jgi:hypothetical protein